MYSTIILPHNNKMFYFNTYDVQGALKFYCLLILNLLFYFLIKFLHYELELRQNIISQMMCYTLSHHHDSMEIE
jgi:hypothetical protein